MTVLDTVEVVVELDGKRYLAGLRGMEAQTAKSMGLIGKHGKAGARSVDQLGNSMSKVSRSPYFGMMAMGATMAATAVAMIGVKAMTMAMNYEQSLTNAISVTGKFGDEAKVAYREADRLARKLGRDTTVSAQECANAMYDLASKGFAVSTWAATLPAIVRLSEATLSDLTSVTELVTSTTKQFNLTQQDAIRISDVYTKAINSSAATQSKLADSMRYVGPVAAAVGWSLEQTTAAVSKLYDAGFVGEQAGTSLRMAMISILKPTEASREAMKKFGITTQVVAKEGLLGVLTRMNEGKATAGDFAQIFEVRTAPAMLKLADYARGGADSVQELTKQLENSAGYAEKTAKVQMATTQGQLKLLKSSMAGVMTSAGTVLLPILAKGFRAMLGPVNKLAEGIRAMGSALSHVPREFWILLTGVGITGGILRFGPSIIHMISKIGKALVGAGAAKAFLTFLMSGPGVAAVAGLGALAGMMYLMRRRTEAMAAAHDNATDSAKKLAESLGLAYDEIEAGTAVTAEATVSMTNFAVANAIAIKQLTELKTVAEKQAYAIQIGYTLVAGGVKPEEAQKAVERLMAASGGGWSMPAIDFANLENMVPYVKSRVGEVMQELNKIGGKGRKVVSLTVEGEEDVEALADVLAHGLSAGQVNASVQGLGELALALEDSTTGAKGQEIIWRHLFDRYTEISGLAPIIGSEFDDLDGFMQGVTDAAELQNTELGRAAHFYMLWRDAGYDVATAMEHVEIECGDLGDAANDVAKEATDLEAALLGVAEGAQLDEEQVKALTDKYQQWADMLGQMVDPINEWEAEVKRAQDAERERAEKQLEQVRKNHEAINRELTDEEADIDTYIREVDGSIETWMKAMEDKQKTIEEMLTSIKRLNQVYGLSEAQAAMLITLGPDFVSQLVLKTPKAVEGVLGVIQTEIEQKTPAWGEAQLNKLFGDSEQLGVQFADKFGEGAKSLTERVEEKIRAIDTELLGYGKGWNLAANFSLGWNANQPKLGANFSLSMAEGETGGGGSRGSMLDFADNFLGKPYVWGGTKPSGWDCSGYVGYVLSKFGVKHPRTAAAMQAYFPKVAAPRPGDLLFYGKPAYHVAMYYGNGQQIEARGRKYGTGIWPVRNYASVGRVPLFDKGGILPPGITLAANFTNRPEAILDPDSTRDLFRLGGQVSRLNNQIQVLANAIGRVQTTPGGVGPTIIQVLDSSGIKKAHEHGRRFGRL